MRRLKPFDYFEPKTVNEAVQLLASAGEHVYPLAGGTDLLVRMKNGDITPTALINLKRIENLNRIEKTVEGGLSIGALTTISELECSSLVRDFYPILAQAAGTLGCPSIRNLATLGGNVGRASPASDLASSLIVLDTHVMIQGVGGEKEMLTEELFAGPGKTVLQKGEIITSFLLPKPMPHTGGIFLKLGRQRAMECALVGVAALLTLSEGNGKEAKKARLCLASVAPIPFRARKAEQVLLSGALTEERFREAAWLAAEESSPISDLRATATYRREMVKVLCFKALREAWEMAREEAEG